MDTVALDENWDIYLDDAGNIALATGAEAIAQDAASQLRLFRGELWYDTAQGVPYWQQILGFLPSAALMKAKFQQAAMLVPGVAKAVVFISSVSNREVEGQVQITTTTGQTATATFNF
jgi:hypothetical protein